GPAARRARVGPPPPAGLLGRRGGVLLGGVDPARPRVPGRGERARHVDGQGAALRRRRLPARLAGGPRRRDASPVAALAGEPADGHAGAGLLRDLPLARGGVRDLPRRPRPAGVHRVAADRAGRHGRRQRRRGGALVPAGRAARPVVQGPPPADVRRMAPGRPPRGGGRLMAPDERPDPGTGAPDAGAAPPEAGPAPGTDAGEEGRAVGTGTVRPPAAGDEGTPAGDDGPGDAADGGGRAGRPGGIRRWLRDNPWVVPTVVVGVAVALPLRGVFRAPGPPMEEGFMIVFPERLLEGDVPNRDFLHLYGPGSLWVIAGFFKVFGVSMWTERVVGFLQLVGVISATTAIGWRWGRYVAALCGTVTAVVIIPPIGVTALAWVR